MFSFEFESHFSSLNILTHLGLVKHICIIMQARPKLVEIMVFSAGQHQAITLSKAGL